MIRTIAFVGFAAASLAANAADIQKCADDAGRITYQDSPCPRGATLGTVPRESAQGDPAALRQLEHERARLERAADAQLAASRNPPPPVVAPIIVQAPGGATAATANGEPVYQYAAPIVAIDPATGQPLVPGVANGQAAGSNVIEPSAITPAPGTPPGAVMPAQEDTSAAITAAPGAAQGLTLPPGAVVSPSGTVVSLPAANATGARVSGTR